MVNEQEADPWTWHLTETSPRGQAGELLLFEAKQGRSSGKTKAAAVRLGAGDKDPGQDGALWRGGDGLGMLLLDVARGCRGRREGREGSPGAEVGHAGEDGQRDDTRSQGRRATEQGGGGGGRGPARSTRWTARAAGSGRRHGHGRRRGRSRAAAVAWRREEAEDGAGLCSSLRVAAQEEDDGETGSGVSERGMTARVGMRRRRRWIGVRLGLTAGRGWALEAGPVEKEVARGLAGLFSIPSFNPLP